MISGPARKKLKEGGSTNPLVDIITPYKRKPVLEKKVGSRLHLRGENPNRLPLPLSVSLSLSLTHTHTHTHTHTQTQVLHVLEAKKHFAIV